MTKTLKLAAATAGLAVMLASPAIAMDGGSGGYHSGHYGGQGHTSAPDGSKSDNGGTKYTVSKKKLNKMDFEVGDPRQRHTQGGGKLKDLGGSNPSANQNDKTNGYGGGDSR